MNEKKSASGDFSHSVNTYYVRVKDCRGNDCEFPIIAKSAPTRYTRGTFYVKNTATGKYLTVNNGKDCDFGAVGVLKYADSNAQRWRIESKNGFYRLFPLCSKTRSLEISGGSVYINVYYGRAYCNCLTVDGDMKYGCILKNGERVLNAAVTGGNWNYVRADNGTAANEWIFEPVN